MAASLGEEAKELSDKSKAVSAVRRDEAPLLEVKQLAAGYGHLEVIRNINLTVRPGEVVACIGPNGAGKTTTLRAISGMIHTRSGKVAFQGRDITNKRAEDIAHRGLVHIPEGRGLFPTLSVEDTLRLVSNTLGREPDLAIAYRLFPKLRERRNQPFSTLSGAPLHMGPLAHSCLTRSNLVMVDEMSQGLAPPLGRRLFATIRGVRDEG